MEAAISQIGWIEATVLTIVAFAAFVGTSLDSLLVLVPVIADRPDRKGPVAVGYLAAFAAIVGLSWGVGVLGSAVVPFDGGLLGAIPVVMGLALLSRRWGFGGKPRRSGSAEPPGAKGAARVAGAAGAMAVLTLSLSADNLAAFVPLMVDSPPGGDLVLALALLVAAVGWVAFAGFLARRPVLRALAERWGGRVLPFLLIAVGIYALANTPFDVLP